VIACIAPHHLDRAGQIPVNAWVRFNPIRPFEAINRP
jgi:allophanate hydrolase subunit 2